MKRSPVKSVFRILSHVVFGTRRYTDKCLRDLAARTKGKTILELGSGKKEGGKQYYSGKRFFDSSNTFIQTDINPSYGHKVVDATKMKYKEEFDIILCMNVLEHVFDFQVAVNNMYKAIKKGGKVAIFVPAMYPLHDEPHDYWRFTEHSLRRVLSAFRKVRVQNSGIRPLPFAYYVEAVK